jgi:hypothetical protein
MVTNNGTTIELELFMNSDEFQILTKDEKPTSSMLFFRECLNHSEPWDGNMTKIKLCLPWSTADEYVVRNTLRNLFSAGSMGGWLSGAKTFSNINSNG